jgi:hypothetical protein
LFDWDIIGEERREKREERRRKKEERRERKAKG